MAYSPIPLMCTLVLVFLHIHACKSLACPRDDDCTCTANEPCELECIGAGHCDGHTLTCQPYQPCLLRCVGDEACLNSTLVSNNASSVSVKCIGEDACLHTAIACESTETCSLTVASGCDATTPAPYTASSTNVPSSSKPTLSPLSFGYLSLDPSTQKTSMPSYSPTIHNIFLEASHHPTPLPTLSPTPMKGTSQPRSLSTADSEPILEYCAIAVLCFMILCLMCVLKRICRKGTESESTIDHIVNGMGGNDDDDDGDDDDDDEKVNFDELKNSGLECGGLQPPAQPRISTASSEDSMYNDAGPTEVTRPSRKSDPISEELYDDGSDQKPTKGAECEGARNRRSLAKWLNAGAAKFGAMVGRDSESASSSKDAVTEYIPR